MLENLHWLVNAVSGWTVALLVAGAVGSVLLFLRVFRSDFEQPD